MRENLSWWEDIGPGTFAGFVLSWRDACFNTVHG